MWNSHYCYTGELKYFPVINIIEDNFMSHEHNDLTIPIIYVKSHESIHMIYHFIYFINLLYNCVDCIKGYLKTNRFFL